MGLEEAFKKQRLEVATQLLCVRIKHDFELEVKIGAGKMKKEYQKEVMERCIELADELILLNETMEC